MIERKYYGATYICGSETEKYIPGAASFGAAARRGHGLHTRPFAWNVTMLIALSFFAALRTNKAIYLPRNMKRVFFIEMKNKQKHTSNSCHHSLYAYFFAACTSLPTKAYPLRSLT